MAETVNINYMANLVSFLKEWDSPVKESEAVRIDIRENELGQKNLTGAEDAPAPAFVRHHPQFEASLEDGIKPLVLFLVKNLDCVTFSSCAGHRGRHPNIIRHVRHVGIVPRDHRELTRLSVALEHAIVQVNLQLEAITVRMDKTDLESEALVMPCLEILFLPTAGREKSYFDEIDSACERLIEQLRLAE